MNIILPHHHASHKTSTAVHRPPNFFRTGPMSSGDLHPDRGEDRRKTLYYSEEQNTKQENLDTTTMHFQFK